MVKVYSISSINDETKEADVFLMADTKAEVTNDPADVIGMPEGYGFAFGSKVMTTGKEMAIMKSDGTWNWGN
jgi:hypothetical protein